MSRLIIVILCFACLSSGAFAQNKTGDIVMRKNFWGIKYSVDGQTLKPREVQDLMKTNDRAYTEFKKAKTNYDVAQVFGFIGGALIGWPVGIAIGGGEPEWGMAAAGAGVILLSVPFSSAYGKRAGNAIKLYNGGNGSTGSVSVHFIPYANGAKLLVKF